MIDLGLVASLLIVISSFGIIANSLAIYAVYRFKHLHNTFGALCAVLGITNVGILLIFVLWCAYGSYLFDVDGTTAKLVGQITLFILDVKVWAHLGVSINRLFSLKFPFKYHAMDSNATVTTAYIAAVVILAFLQVTPLFWASECYFVYFKDIAVWGYGESTCNDFYSFYIDFFMSVIILCFIVLLDGASVLTLRKVSEFSQAHNSQRRKTEIGFFVQSLCQMVPFILAYVSFDVLSGYASDDWMLFGTTTFVWTILHAIDGTIMLAFQARKVIVRKKVLAITISSKHGDATISNIASSSKPLSGVNSIVP